VAKPDQYQDSLVIGRTFQKGCPHIYLLLNLCVLQRPLRGAISRFRFPLREHRGLHDRNVAPAEERTASPTPCRGVANVVCKSLGLPHDDSGVVGVPRDYCL